MRNTNTLAFGPLCSKPDRSIFTRAVYLFLILIFVGLSFPFVANAQSNDIVTNQTIIELSRAGIGKQVILSKIENSTCNFDLSTDGLIYLKNNGVPDDIVATMISKSNNANQPPNGQAQNSVDPNAQQGNGPNAQADDNVTAKTAPPELPTYEQPECPVEGYLWQPGYWAFNLANGFFWVPGVWIAPPNPGYLWTPGYWGFAGGFYVFHRGYWGHSVGFYGGINYGYGYGGVGFIGGGWHGNVYRYNTAVVRVNTVVIHNTYVDRTVINNTTVVNRTSFNGRGGVVASPRPQELAAMKEPHIQPTAEQVSHQQLASTDKNQFAKVNNGHPAQAALPKVDEAAISRQRAANPGVNRGTNPDRPSGNGNNPANNPNKPIDNNVTHPAGNDKLPANNGTPPANNTNRPADKINQPANDASRPATNNTNPAGNTNRPATNNANPGNNNNRQGGGRNRAVNNQKQAPRPQQQRNNNPKPEKKNDKKQ